jgi:hypothetical protein
MQICPHCAKPVEDSARMCDHCGHVVLENSIDEALRALDLKLAVPMDLAQPPMPDAPSTATLQPSNSEDWLQWADAPVAAQPPDAEAWLQGVDPIVAGPSPDVEGWSPGVDPPVAAQPPDAEAWLQGVDPIVAGPSPDVEGWSPGVDPPVAAQPPDPEGWSQGADPRVASPPTGSEASSRGMHPDVAGSAWKSWPVAATAVAAFAVGMAIMMTRSSTPALASTVGLAGNSVQVAKVPVSQPPAAEVHVVQRPRVAVDPLRSPKWVRARQPGWMTDGSRIVSFELEAENDVRVWMKHVRPVLAVRCLGRHTEVFVITDSAMSIEPTPDQHTVHVSFDGGAEAEERWLDSDAKRELFAPDGVALARQLASAHTMRFGFTPYNGSAAVVEFDVRGLAGLLEPVARTCGSPSSAKAASARSGG